MDRQGALARATQAWDVSAETLEDVNRRIHDGVPAEAIEQRADRYADRIVSFLPAGARPRRILEIGPGVGFIMQALARRLAVPDITGLDISPSMIAKAQARLRTSAPDLTASFHAYDGVNVPLQDASFDLIYSVAALQHVPKPYVYNLFFEIKRLLAADGLAVVHLLSYVDLPNNGRWFPWAEEVAQQVGKPKLSDRNAHGHWHHYYSVEELTAVLKETGFAHVNVRAERGLWVAF